MNRKHVASPDGEPRHAGGDASQALRQGVSALMDGEPVSGSTHDEALARVARDPAARQAWLEYHQIGDCLRSSQGHGSFNDAAFLERFGERLRAEPVQVAPGALRGARRFPLAGLSMVAGLGSAVAAVVALAVVGLGGVLPQPFGSWRHQHPALRAGAAVVARAAMPATGASTHGAVPGSVLTEAARRALLGESMCMQPLHDHAPGRLRAAP